MQRCSYTKYATASPASSAASVVARGPSFEGSVVAGSCVGVAARRCAQHGVLLSKPAAEALEPDLLGGLRTVPVFLQGSDSSGVLEEFCQVLC